ncbi:alpha-hydroxy acid oxidase, partial [Eudoraea sp.]|uniref:alpha-hydroxy acid oxidase n=1 Tax=Eudoraea sp. TaxID=1979955 RepID=UPI003C758813
MRNANHINFDSRYPSIETLRARAKKRIPGFAFDYLDGGCNEEVNIKKNTEEIRQVELRPDYLSAYAGLSLETELFGHTYDAPFGISPVGLQGLMWPKASEILAKSSLTYNLPFILSTVTTMSIERASEITEGRAWFQLYHPSDDAVRDDIINRAEAAGCPV